MPKPWQDVEGWLTPAEAATLQQLAAGKTVLEIGAWKGRSSLALAATAASVLSLDHFQGDDYAGRADTLQEWLANTEGRCNLLWGPCEKLLPLLNLSLFRLIYYDADHTYAATAGALHHIRQQLNLAGRHYAIAVHDYEPGNSLYLGVVQAVDGFRIRTGREMLLTERLAYFPPTSW